MLRKSTFTLIALLLLATASLRAQSPTGGTTFLDIISVQQELGFTLSENYEYAFPADLQGGYNGDVSAGRFTTALDYGTNWDRGFWRVGFSFEYTDWSWGGQEYFGDTYQLNLQTIFGQRFLDSDWGMLAVLGASLGAEYDGGNLARGGTYRAGAAVTYYFGDYDSFSFGALVIGQEEFNMYIYPLPILNWQITEDLNLRTFNGFTLSYDASGDGATSVDFTTEYESDLFRLKTRPVTPFNPFVTQTPVVEKDVLSLTAGVTQRLGAGFYVRGYIEGIVWRRFRFTEDHTTYRNFKTDPTLSLGIQAGVRF